MFLKTVSGVSGVTEVAAVTILCTKVLEEMVQLPLKLCGSADLDNWIFCNSIYNVREENSNLFNGGMMER